MTNPFIVAYQDFVWWVNYKIFRIKFIWTNRNEEMGFFSWKLTFYRTLRYGLYRTNRYSIRWAVKFCVESLYLYHRYVYLCIRDVFLVIWWSGLRIGLKYVGGFILLVLGVFTRRDYKRYKAAARYDGNLVWIQCKFRFFENVYEPIMRTVTFLWGSDECAAIIWVLFFAQYFFFLLLLPYFDEFFYRGRKLPYFAFYYLNFAWPTYYWFFMLLWASYVFFISARYSYIFNELTPGQLILTLFILSLGFIAISLIYVGLYWLFFHIYWERRTDKIEFQILLERGKNFFLEGMVTFIYKEVAADPEIPERDWSWVWWVIGGIFGLACLSVGAILYLGDTGDYVFDLNIERRIFVVNPQHYPWRQCGLPYYRMSMHESWKEFCREDYEQYVKDHLWLLIEMEIGHFESRKQRVAFRKVLHVLYASLKLEPLFVYQVAEYLHDLSIKNPVFKERQLIRFFEEKNLNYRELINYGLKNLRERVVTMVEGRPGRNTKIYPILLTI